MGFQLVTAHHKSGNKTFVDRLISWLFSADAYFVRTNTPSRDGTISACVVDGISRDLANGKIATPRNALVATFTEDLFIVPKYVYDVFRLKMAARHCAKMFTLSHESITGRIKAVNYYMDYINHKIRQGKTCDYLGNNFYGCTAAGIVIKDDILEIFNIGDSNVILVKKDGSIICAPLPDPYNMDSDKRDAYIRTCKNFRGMLCDWEDNSFRATFRKSFSNTDAPGHVGVLNGKSVALKYTNVQSFDLNADENKNIEYIAIYSDGYINQITHIDTRLKIVRGQYYRSKGDERTVVSFQKRIDYQNNSGRRK